jgi:2-oxoglutarate ferredoxin oxidoreductase subunit alpha
LIPQVDELPPIPVHFATMPNGEEDGRPVFLPYQRDEVLARPWAIPGTPGLEHRVGGLEKQDITGNISYDPINHEHMVHLRAEKIARIAEDIPPLKVHGPESGDLLVVGWGGTYGSLLTAVQRLQRKGRAVALAHFRHLNPMPANTAEVLGRYKKVLVCELNNGQLQWLIRSRYLVDAQGLHKIQGKPFLVSEIEQAVEQQLAVTCNGVAKA